CTGTTANRTTETKDAGAGASESEETSNRSGGVCSWYSFWSRHHSLYDSDFYYDYYLCGIHRKYRSWRPAIRYVCAWERHHIGCCCNFFVCLSKGVYEQIGTVRFSECRYYLNFGSSVSYVLLSEDAFAGKCKFVHYLDPLVL